MATFEEMQALLGRQMSMTGETWRRLATHGVTDGSVLVLEFVLKSPSFKAATALKDFLAEETDYEVRMAADADEWTVHGTTQPTPVTLAILQQWVDWMVAAGFRFEARFDGWGAEVP